jgi:hypothetical protein
VSGHLLGVDLGIQTGSLAMRMHCYNGFSRVGLAIFNLARCSRRARTLP